MLLDTTILIDFVRGKERAGDMLRSVDLALVYTTEVNVFELMMGLYLTKKNAPEQLEKISALLSKITVLPLDRKSSLKAGEICGTLISQGKEIQETDCLIAGIALAHGVTSIVTANKNHFERISQLRVVSY